MQFILRNEQLNVQYFLSFILCFIILLFILLFCPFIKILELSLILLTLTILITYLNLEKSIHYSLKIYSEIAKIFHLKNPNVNYIDDDGIPYVDFGFKEGRYVGVQRNPLTISNKADLYYNLYKKTNDPQYLKYFFNCVNFLSGMKYHFKDGNIEYNIYPYSFVIEERYQENPWYSAMAQSAISVTLLKAYDLTLKNEYLLNSDLAMNALRIPIKNGGVLDIDLNDGGYWFEEIASKNKFTLKTNILNGHLFCILDLINYQKIRPFDYVSEMLEKSISEVKNHINEYDLGYWTNYDRVNHFAFDYHYVHIKLFKDLYRQTQDPFFRNYYKKWALYFPYNPMWARKRFIGFMFNSVICVFILILLVYTT